jgi:hypothetical protein
MISGMYVVVHPFRYGKQHLRAGDEWEPRNNKLDSKIIKGGYYVRFEPTRPDGTRGLKRRITNGTTTQADQ